MTTKELEEILEDNIKENKKYYDFKSFAAAAGVSLQSLYKAKKLKPYIIEVDGIKKIDEEALLLYENSTVEQPLNNGENVDTDENLKEKNSTVEQPLNNGERVTENQSEIIAALRSSIDIISRQLEDKQRELDNKQKTIDKLLERVEADGQRLENMQVLIKQQQQLAALDKKQEEEAAAAEPQENKKHWWEFWKN